MHQNKILMYMYLFHAFRFYILHTVISCAYDHLSLATITSPPTDYNIAKFVHVYDVYFMFQGQFTLTYNFYDFSEQHPDLSNFDIRPCYTGNQIRHFLIKFRGILYTFNILSSFSLVLIILTFILIFYDPDFAG